MSQTKYDIFISYSRKDTAIADKICATLDKEGITYFIDRAGIGGGMEFPEVLAEEISASRLFLFLASKNSYESKYTNSEITFAFNEKPKNTILPYIIDGSQMPKAMRFIFSGITWRTIMEHPIEPVLVNDLLNLLGDLKKDNISHETILQSKISDSTIIKSYRQYWWILFIIICVPIGFFLKINDYSKGELLFQKAEDCFSKAEFAEGFKWYKEASGLDHMEAKFKLAQIYEYGLHGRNNEQIIKADSVKSIIYYQEAATLGHPKSQYIIGMRLNNNEGVKWYKKAAEQGYARAQVKLGYAYKNGNGVSQNYVEAAKWFREAANSNNPQAINELGNCYYEGVGVPQSYTEAIKWYQRAADMGNDEAMKNIGLCYYYGQGVLQDYQEAVKWFYKAADLYNNEAAYYLGYCYESGLGVSKDYNKAVKLYSKAADEVDGGGNYADARAEYKLGEYYENNKKDLDRALLLYERSARAGNEAALRKLRSISPRAYAKIINLPNF